MHGHGSTIKPDVGEEATWQGRWFNSFPPTLSSWPNVKSLSICNYFNSVTRGNEALITMHRIAMKRNHNFFPELYEMGWKEEEEEEEDQLKIMIILPVGKYPQIIKLAMTMTTTAIITNEKSKGMLKSKVMLDLHFLMKRGKILGKALNEIIVQQHNTLSCISQDVHMSFISPREYEFSCSGSPAYKFYSHKHPYYQAKRRKLLDHYKHARFHAPSQDGTDDLVSSACGGDVVVEASPLVGSARWFGTWSPLVRQVRITDSPFTMRDADEDCHVDKEAEKFIEMFYKQLRLQKWMAAHEAAV
ncbi:hypothetical protein DKX38_027967 [Salix brachista]|uniref:Uncharacterized protein n=1 Tax=Salix brachista TaxID=2182728 RepID=A0A5N5J4H1_9ROSI|nr:hypothetical protein DKX38_027967 [Salix brachista]